MADGRPRSEASDVLIVGGRIAAIQPGLAASSGVQANRVHVAWQIVVATSTTAAYSNAISGIVDE